MPVIALMLFWERQGKAGIGLHIWEADGQVMGAWLDVRGRGWESNEIWLKPPVLLFQAKYFIT